MRKYRPVNWPAVMRCASLRARIQRSYGNARKRLVSVADASKSGALKAMLADVAFADLARGAEELHILATRGHSRHYSQSGKRQDLYHELTRYTRDRESGKSEEASAKALTKRILALLRNAEDGDLFRRTVAEYRLVDWQRERQRYNATHSAPTPTPDGEVTDQTPTPDAAPQICEDCLTNPIAEGEFVDCRVCNEPKAVCQDDADWRDYNANAEINATVYTLVCVDCETGKTK